MKLNSAYSVIDEEGSHYKEKVEVKKENKIFLMVQGFLNRYKIWEKRQYGPKAKYLDISRWLHSVLFVGAAMINSSTTLIDSICCPDSLIDHKVYDSSLVISL